MQLHLTLCNMVLNSVRAIFILRSTIEYFVSKSSSVYAASLDTSKVVDIVHHLKFLDHFGWSEFLRELYT
jgi:hypothetical protein